MKATHAAYNKAVSNLLKDFKKVVSPNGSLQAGPAKDFLALIKQGKTGELSAAFLAQHADDLKVVTAWRQGFVDSITMANEFIKMAIQTHTPLDKKELKWMVRNWVNGTNIKLSGEATSMFEAVALDLKGKTPASRFAWFGVARAVTIITVIGVAFDAKRGFAGEGKFKSVDGIQGAALEAADKWMEGIVFKDQAEAYVFPPILGGMEGVKDVIMAPAPTIRQRGLKYNIDIGQ